MKSYSYKAFISYSHAADGKLAPALQSGLHRFAKPWFRLRALRVFRDKTNLAINPALWSYIEKALDDSEFFLLFASPQAGASIWVRREVEHWLKNYSPQNILIVLTEGDLYWDERAGDFDWSKTTALPPSLEKAFTEEPLYLDLRWAKSEEHLSLSNPQFRDAVAELAAPLHGRPKDEIIGEDVRQFRHTRRVAWTAGIALFVLTLSSIIAAWLAVQQRNIAEGRRIEADRQRGIALARQLAAQAELTRTQKPDLLPRSLLLAVESLRRFPSLEADQALRRAMALLPRPVARFKHSSRVDAIAFSTDGKFLATADQNAARILEIARGRETATIVHQDLVTALAYSSDGKHLATASQDKTVCLADAASGKEILRLNHPGQVGAVAFSEDAKLLLTTSEDTAHLWEVATGKERARFTHENKGFVRAACLSSDATRVATASLDKTARIWDAATGAQSARLQHDGEVVLIALSSDNHRIATACWQKTAYLWDAMTGHEIARLDHDDAITSLCFSPNGKSLVTTSHDNTARLWSADSGQELKRLEHGSVVETAAFSSDGKKFATAGYDNTARVWDAENGREALRVVHDGYLTAVAFSPDGRFLATSCVDAYVRVWETSGFGESVRMKHSNLDGIAFSPDGALLATASAGNGSDGTVRLWDIQSGQELRQMKSDDSLYTFTFSRSGRLIATASSDRTARVWETATGREVTKVRCDSHVTSAALSADEQFLATTSYKSAQIWSCADGREVARFNHDVALRVVAFSPDGKYLATASRELKNSAWLWEIDSRREVVRFSLQSGVRSLSFSPDGRLLATGSEASDDAGTRLWKVPTGRQVAYLPSDTGTVDQIIFRPDGKYLASANSTATARVLDVASGVEIARLYHEGMVNGVAFSPDGKFLATAGREGAARIWELATGQELERLVFGGQVSHVAFSPDGRYLATSSDDDTARLWLWQREDLLSEACARLTGNLSEEEWRQFFGTEPYRKTCPELP